MSARRARIRTTIATLLTAGSLAAAGAALTAAPAHAQTPPGQCPPATSPPSPNTWIDSAGNYRGVRKISDERGPGGTIPLWSTQVYETFGADYYQRETWDVDRFRGGGHAHGLHPQRA